MTVTASDVQAARAAVETVARRTPILSTRTFSERAGGTVVLKAENLQRTGSFKVRGVAAKLDSLGEEGCARGVVAASAGNHAQALAAAAAARGVPCEVFVPADAPMAKVEAAREQGATVHVGGASVDACLVAALERAETGGLAFVHPFDDPAIVAGQGSLGLELLEDVPELARVVIPVGGGGLAAGVAIAIKAARPDVSIIGVQAAACAPFPESMAAGEPIEASSALTIADGIAVKRPGGITLPILTELTDEIVTVDEDATAEAMALLLERCKLVVEGAGAVGVAALLGGRVKPAAEGTTVAVLSGGNVDAGLLATIARRHETEAGRRLVVLTRVPDRPGMLATLLATVAGTGANIVDVSHVREGLDLHVRETAVAHGAGDARARARPAGADHAAGGGLRAAGPALSNLSANRRQGGRSRLRRMTLPRILLATGLAALALPAVASADSIVYIDQGNVWSATPDGARKVQLTGGGSWHSPTQADDGTIAAVQGTGPIQVMARDGRPLRTITTQPASSGDGGTFAPRPVQLSFSPDGTKIAYAYVAYSCPVASTCGSIQRSVFYTHAGCRCGDADHGLRQPAQRLEPGVGDELAHARVRRLRPPGGDRRPRRRRLQLQALDGPERGHGRRRGLP